MSRPKCLMRDFTMFYRIYKAHYTNVWWTMKVFQLHMMAFVLVMLEWRSQVSQHDGCWCPDTYLVSGHQQPSWWPMPISHQLISGLLLHDEGGRIKIMAHVTSLNKLDKNIRCTSGQEYTLISFHNHNDHHKHGYIHRLISDTTKQNYRTKLRNWANYHRKCF